MEITSTQIFYAASKRRSYRKVTRARFDALVNFLRQQQWLSADASHRYDETSEDWLLSHSDLTDAGCEFKERHFDEGLGMLDRRKSRHTYDDYLGDLHVFLEQ